MNQCRDCYWYSEVTCGCCKREHEPVDPTDNACVFFDEKEGEG